ncbi:RtcB family protein [Streptosporangium lutulentum]
MPNQAAPNLLSWASDIEAGAIEQAARASRLPFVASHVALMPDAHVGIGATVGSVIPTKGAIIPAAVGVDIGCGMIATETTLTAADLPDNLAALMPLVEKRIPAGVGQGHDDPAVDQALSELDRPHTDLSPKQEKTVSCQFGTLGSGNHFVEVCLDEQDRVWTVLHSGSRGIGNQLATKHIAEAKKLMQRYFIELEDPDLAYLVQGTPEFTAYIEDMLWSQRYAMASRARMDKTLSAALFSVAGKGSRVRTINCHHNFTQQENHHGKNLWITRKGAIKADTGDEGVIPGSMGTRSYIVRGLGNPASYTSCSHGAGRRMSRGQARRSLSPSH